MIKSDLQSALFHFFDVIILSRCAPQECQLLGSAVSAGLSVPCLFRASPWPSRWEKGNHPETACSPAGPSFVLQPCRLSQVDHFGVKNVAHVWSWPQRISITLAFFFWGKRIKIAACRRSTAPGCPKRRFVLMSSIGC